MSQLSAILEVLKDGRPHSVAEIHRRAGTSRLNSRISDLRRDGYVIKCGTVKGKTNAERYVYRLLMEPRIPSSAGAADGAGEAGGRTPASGSSSGTAPAEVLSPSAVVSTTPQTYAEPPEPFPPQSVAPGQLTFEAA